MATQLTRLGKLVPRSSALFVCDVQTKFVPVISGMPAVIDTTSRMARGSGSLGIPVIATEQYPKALGSTVDEVKSALPKDTPIVSKTLFSMLTPEVESWLGDRPSVKQVMLVGIEAHVCILQTTLDLLQRGYEVHLLTDGISSQRPHDRAVALQRMLQAGVHAYRSSAMMQGEMATKQNLSPFEVLVIESAFLSTSELALFQLVADAKGAGFKEISALAKEPRVALPFFEMSSL